MQKKKSHKTLYITLFIIITSILLAGIGLGLYYAFKPKHSSTPTPPPVTKYKCDPSQGCIPCATGESCSYDKGCNGKCIQYYKCHNTQGPSPDKYSDTPVAGEYTEEEIKKCQKYHKCVGTICTECPEYSYGITDTCKFETSNCGSGCGGTTTKYRCDKSGGGKCIECEPGEQGCTEKCDDSDSGDCAFFQCDPSQNKCVRCP